MNLKYIRTVERVPVWWQEHSLEWLYRLMKEQGVVCLYPNPMRRMAGNIDLWVIGNAFEVRRIR